MTNEEIKSMPFEQKIARINVLAKKSKTEEGLTPEEKEEQRLLRADYIAGFRMSLQSQLDNMYIVDENGNEQKITQKKPIEH